MNVIRTLLMALFWLVATPICALVAIPHALITRRPDFLYRTGMMIAATGVRIAGVDVSTEGVGRLEPNRTYIFMSNHVSNIDPPIIIPRIPRRTFVLAKKELFRIPILAQAMRIAQFVPVDRTHRDSALVSLDRAADVLGTGLSMMVYVEGTRSWDGRLLPFKKGPFYLAMMAGVPVVPITIVGGYEVLPKGKSIVRPGLVRLIFHEPIDPSQFDSKEALMIAVRERIASALPPSFRD